MKAYQPYLLCDYIKTIVNSGLFDLLNIIYFFVNRTKFHAVGSAIDAATSLTASPAINGQRPHSNVLDNPIPRLIESQGNPKR